MLHFRPKRPTVLLTATIVLATMAAAKEPPDYLATVRSYADALIEHGRDTYGETPSPLFAVTLDRVTLEPGPTTPIAGIREHDRMSTGANPMHDENLYQILYALTAITGDRRYAAQADASLTWFFEHCQSPTTGLMAWGEHIGWDLYTERPMEKGAGDIHEFYRPWVLWPKSYSLAPDACAQFAKGLWEHQILNHKTGEFSRHAGWSKHKTGGDNEYPRHGGFYIATWAQAYRRSQNPIFLKAIETLLDYYEGLSSEITGAIPCSTAEKRKKIMWPSSNLSLAVDLWDAAGAVPNDLAEKMRRRAEKTDAVFLKLAHDFSPKGIGFAAGADIDTLGGYAEGKWTHTEPWATSYGNSTDAQVAMLCMLRFQQTGEERYKALVVAAGERYLTSEPNTNVELYPGAFGDVICLMCTCRELTGDDKFLTRADYFAERAQALFFDDTCSLPKGSTACNHYEAVTRADTLMMGLLSLWLLHHPGAPRVSLVYTDR